MTSCYQSCTKLARRSLGLRYEADYNLPHWCNWALGRIRTARFAVAT